MEARQQGSPGVPTADWRDVSCDGQILRGVSSILGDFEHSFEEVLAVAAHVRYPDDTDPFLPDMDCWLTFLTRQEYGFIYETQLTETLLSELRIFLRDEHLRLYPAWGRWNMERGCDSRFIYPPWIDGFSVYDWRNERRGRRSRFSRLIGSYGYPASEGSLGPTIDWLMSTDRDDQKRRWEETSANPPRPTALGSRRSRHFRQSKHGIVPIVACSVALGIGAAGWPESFHSLQGVISMFPLALLASSPWWPQLFCETRLHDHGISFRRWFFHARTIYYHDIRVVVEDDAGTKIIIGDGESIRLPKRHTVAGVTIRDLQRRSLAMSCAAQMGVPYRLPETT